MLSPNQMTGEQFDLLFDDFAQFKRVVKKSEKVYFASSWV